MRNTGFVLLVVLLALAVSSLAADAPVTFAKDIAPILQEKCQDCHRKGSMAPMSLLTYDIARPWAQAMRKAVT